MPDISVAATLAATVVAFVVGGAYYAAVGDRLAALSPAGAAAAEMPPWKVGVELARCLLLAIVVAGVAAQGAVDELPGGLALAVALWVGFPFVLWVGATTHERTPVPLAAIHAGDWLLKLVAIAAVVTLAS